MSVSRIAVALTLACWLGKGAAQSSEPMRIPPVHGPVLTGENVDMPEALKGKVGVLVMGFSQASRDEVTEWGKWLAGQFRNSGDVAYYEMPVLESVPRMLRAFVVRQMSKSVPEVERSHFLPVLDHEPEWKKATGFANPDDAYLMVVDATGVVQWKTKGGVTDGTTAEVMRQIERLRAAAGRNSH
jgi:hypothetical protein